MRTPRRFLLYTMLAISGATYAQITDDENVNNSCTGAFNETLPLDIPNPAQIGPTTADEDWVKVELPPQGGILTVWIDPVLNASFSIQVYKTCGGPLVLDNPNPPVSDSTGLAALLCGGQHFIRIARHGGTAPAPINYVLHATYDVSSDPYECNNSFVEASLVPLDASFQAKLYGMNKTLPGVPGSAFFSVNDRDRDYYQVNSSGCGTLTVSITDAPADQRFSIIAYDASTTTIIHDITHAAAAGGDVSITILIPAGTTYILVSEYNQFVDFQVPVMNPDPYTITFSFDDSDAFECNNSFTEASLLPLDTSFQAKLYGINNTLPAVPGSAFFSVSNRDRDYYQVNSPGCGVLTASITNAPSTQRLSLTAFDASTTTTLHGNTYAPAPGGDVSISVLIPAGITYILVSEYNQFVDFQVPVMSPDPYTITFSFDDGDTCECNNTLATACPIEVNTALDFKLYGVNTTFTPAQDVDHFIFDVDCDTLRAVVTDVPATQRIRLTLYNPDLTQNGSPVTASTQGGDVTLQRIGLPEGQYVLQVSENSNTMSADAYTLMVQCGLNNVSTGPERSMQQRMSVAPNPATTFLAITFAQHAQAHHLTLLDATGRMVLERPVANSSGLITMDLSGHDNGLYFIQVVFADGTRVVERVVKE